MRDESRPAAGRRLSAVSRIHRAGRTGRAGVDARGAGATTAAGVSCRRAIFGTPSRSSGLRCGRPTSTRRWRAAATWSWPERSRARRWAFFDRALAVRADYLSALVGRGEALLELQREADAIAAFEARACRRPGADRRPPACRGAEVPVARARPGRGAAGRAGRAGATRRSRRIGPRSSRRPTARSSIGSWRRSSAGRGDADAALEHFRRAVALDPADAASLGQIARDARSGGEHAEALRAVRRGARDRAERRSDEAPGRAARADRAGGAARGVPGDRRRAADHARRPGGADRRPPRACCCSASRARRSSSPTCAATGRAPGSWRWRGPASMEAVRQPHVSAARGRRRADLAEAVARLLARPRAVRSGSGRWRAAARPVLRCSRRPPGVSGGVGGGRVGRARSKRRRELPAVAARDRRGSGAGGRTAARDDAARSGSSVRR